MAQTRGATGNAKPRIFTTPSTEPVRKRKAGTTTKKRTAKPKSTTGAGVTKKRAPAKSKSSLKDKVEGAVEKVAGAVERKPGKKAAGTKKIKGTDGKTSKAVKI
ncbi:uncharacterized protein PV06_03763 [Exophiala oligosperma]|uniref:Uncharacterized protein n=2 Tax=Chaetothyriales TaxID=34395 RepID=A0A0D2C6D2_9EURO|nr:uncharacterized protein PV06_03763 [Exophiala oligosperma]KAJ9641739.1 hypothetical protein H2204_002801 [Knufia peltigerae]KIW45367.1 hypothetical protein PV06_03763 [Exophiala oligosperma]